MSGLWKDVLRYYAVEIAALLPVVVALAAWTDMPTWQVFVIFTLIGVYAGVSSAVDRWREREKWRARFLAAMRRPNVWDAGHSTVGHALGVVLVLGAFLLLLGLAGGIEGGAL